MWHGILHKERRLNGSINRGRLYRGIRADGIVEYKALTNDNEMKVGYMTKTKSEIDKVKGSLTYFIKKYVVVNGKPLRLSKAQEKLLKCIK